MITRMIGKFPRVLLHPILAHTVRRLMHWLSKVCGIHMLYVAMLTSVSRLATRMGS